MTSLAWTADFKYTERGRRNLIVLVPGWATDFRIFQLLDLDFNYLLSPLPLPFSFERSLLGEVKKRKLKKLSFLGWSLGGFLAADFSSKYPDLVDQLILVGIRQKYTAAEILKMQNFLERNKRNCLCKFYQQCFFRKEKWLWFKQNLLNNYIDSFSLNYLLEGLSYLKSFQITAAALQKIKKLKIIHGEADKIAPLKEALKIKESLPQAEFILLEGAGHAAFLEEDLSLRI